MTPQLLISACLRRTSSTAWATLDDVGHASYGIAAVEVYADRIRVNYDFTAYKVSSVQVTPDEAFASAGIRMGASVGLNHMDIYFYSNGSATPINPGTLSKAGANVWVTGWFYPSE